MSHPALMCLTGVCAECSRARTKFSGWQVSRAQQPIHPRPHSPADYHTIHLFKRCKVGAGSLTHDQQLSCVILNTHKEAANLRLMKALLVCHRCPSFRLSLHGEPRCAMCCVSILHCEYTALWNSINCITLGCYSFILLVCCVCFS